MRSKALAQQHVAAAFRLLLAHLAALAFLTTAARAAASAPDRPNVVLILADDLGYGDLGCYGHPKFRTPHLDRLASQGARFTQFNTPAPFCAPTRASLLTGLYPVHCGLPLNPTPDGRPQADALALPTQRLLPGYLKQAGYATAMIGKWHLGHRNIEHWPTRRGFDEYLGILYSNDMRPVRLIDGEQAVESRLKRQTASPNRRPKSSAAVGDRRFGRRAATTRIRPRPAWRTTGHDSRSPLEAARAGARKPASAFAG
jgi:arylsulfatase A-like enzyme